jgi:hypothetical protein
MSEKLRVQGMGDSAFFSAEVLLLLLLLSQAHVFIKGAFGWQSYMIVVTHLRSTAAVNYAFDHDAAAADIQH